MSWREPFRHGEVVYDEPDGLIICGDCREVLAKFPRKSIVAVITDPPFGISDASSKRVAFKNGVPATVNYGEWDCFDNEEEYEKFIAPCLRAVSRVSCPGASLYIYGDRLMLGSVVAPVLRKELGWHFKGKVYAVKRNPAPRWRRNNWNSCVQECGWFVKGRTKPARFNFGSHKEMLNVFYYSVGRKSRHPTQKQPEAITPLVKVATNSIGSMLDAFEDIVLDPFMGSGQTLVSAREHGCRFIGIDRDMGYCVGAATWLHEEQPAQTKG